MTGAAPEGTATLEGTGEGAEGGGESTYTPPATQADLDRIIQDRLKRAKPADYDDLKSKAAEYDKYKESSKTEQQKAIEAARAEGAQEVTGKFTTRIVNADIRATAATLGFSDPQDAIALFGDISKVEITDDGPDAKAIKARLDEIAKDKPYLLKTTTGPKVVTKPKPVKGEESDADNKPGKSKAAAALRQLGAARRGE
ncbi:hypothetical protein ACX800_09980 [Paenarthrobacter nitroguajacolicus]|uniref:hypothetical protein n=1 Tax=Paenarthrobacter nitroguajacolicus TaxID=211146 RepID=UPI003D22BE4D